MKENHGKILFNLEVDSTKQTKNRFPSSFKVADPVKAIYLKPIGDSIIHVYTCDNQMELNSNIYKIELCSNEFELLSQVNDKITNQIVYTWVSDFDLVYFENRYRRMYNEQFGIHNIEPYMSDAIKINMHNKISLLDIYRALYPTADSYRLGSCIPDGFKTDDHIQSSFTFFTQMIVDLDALSKLYPRIVK